MLDFSRAVPVRIVLRLGGRPAWFGFLKKHSRSAKQENQERQADELQQDATQKSSGPP